MLVNSSVLPAHKKPLRKKVYMWKRANKQAMEEDLTKFIEKFTKDLSTSTHVNMLWNSFKQKCIESIDTFVPSKMTSTRFIKHGATVTFVASQEGGKGHSRKHVLPRNHHARASIDTRRSRKKPSKYIDNSFLVLEDFSLAC